ncbi:MAG: hypothetical protein WD231_05490 [Candidatus Woykebacteria bacterium]
MNFIYTKHAEEKLQRLDVVKFSVTKKRLESVIKRPNRSGKSKTGEGIAIGYLFGTYIIRIVHDIMTDDKIKIITFHVSKRGRYGT